MTIDIDSPLPTEALQELKPTLTMYTFAEIISEIEASHARARVEQSSWLRLREVAERLASLEPASSVDLGQGTRWSLVRISIKNYGGVLNSSPLVINLDASPGVTVLHGANGAGKSSVSDAIEATLLGSALPKDAGVGINAPLWEPIPVGRSNPTAQVELTLQSGIKKLHLSCTFHKDGTTSDRVSNIEENGFIKPVHLGSKWKDWLKNHQPVFAYASIDRRVRLSRDLAEYFENLLALGGCFAELEEEIRRRSEEADACLAKWTAACRYVLKAVNDIDAQRRNGVVNEPAPLTAPLIGGVIDKWLGDNGLTQTGIRAAEIPSDAVTNLLISAQKVDSSIATFENARTTSEETMYIQLASLEEIARGMENPGGVCPVCRKEGREWLDTLSATVSRLRDLDRSAKDAIAQIVELSSHVGSSLNLMLQMAPHADTHLTLLASKNAGTALMNAFIAARNSDGNNASSLVISTSKQLVAWLQTEDAHELMQSAIAQADRVMQWKIERTDAVKDFVTVWRREASKAIEATEWKKAAAHVNDLRIRLRKARSTTLSTKATIRVEKLLADVGLTLSGLEVKATMAKMDLMDGEGNRVELGMLSAGQRNAILLAPLLASIEEGPFGFLILDDPVHAFDELRIDRLAQSLSELAIDRRVVVLTHDERLREHLSSRSVLCDSRLVSRSISDGTVSIHSSGQFWSRLLDDAKIILEMNEEVSSVSMSVTDTVRGLCRQALDNATREFVLGNALVNARDLDGDMKKLDSRPTSKLRLEFAESVHGTITNSRDGVRQAKEQVERHFGDWNRASHGNEAKSDVNLEEIQATRRACEFLMGASRT
jgi:energy-coupling factor transporter ATP-binding protein EcfA2